MSFEEIGDNVHDAGDKTLTKTETERAPRLPPRWFIRFFWVMHRAVYSATGGRIGLRNAKPDREGMLRLRTIGRRTGERRTAILAYLEDGPNLITLAMNGWADPEPAWWLNLEAQGHATVDLHGRSRTVTGRLASEDERVRLWALWVGLDEGTNEYAALRSRETAVVILEPVRAPGS